MADRGLSITNPLMDSMNVGLRVPSAPRQGDPATRMGLGNLQDTQADQLVGGGGDYVPGKYAMESVGRIKAPKVAPAYFREATNEMFAGDRPFAAEDVRSALESSAAPTTQAPTGEGWTPLPESSYRQYLNSLTERRTTGELLGRGVRQVGETTLGGIGAGLELAGATEAGPALRGFAKGMFGPTENEQIRDSLIAENSTMWERIVDASIQSGPTLGAIVLSGGAVGLGLKAAGAGATAMTAGATAGAAGVSFPMHLSSFYDAAERNGYDLTDPKVKTEIVAGAVTNTLLDSFGPASVFSAGFRRLAGDVGNTVARGALRNAATGAARVGFTEALTEGTQTLLESVAFDPEARAMLSVNDLKALAPYIADKYGEDILVSMGAGAILGGGIGGAVSARATGPKEIPSDRTTDLTQTATEQTTEEAPAFDYTSQIPPGMGRLRVPSVPTQGYLTETGLLPFSYTEPSLPGTTLPSAPLPPELAPQPAVTAPSGARSLQRGGVSPVPAGQALLSLPAPTAPTGLLPAPGVSAADFTAGPEGVVPTGAPTPRPGSYEAAVADGLPPAPIPAAPATPKSAVVSETVIPDTGLTLVHGGKPGLTLDAIEIVRPADQMKQGKKGRVYGGFYATTEEDADQAAGYAGKDGAVYDVRIKPGTKVAEKPGDVTRLSKGVIDQYVADGYGVIVGKDPRGRTEYVVLDKNAIESVTPRTPPAPIPAPGKKRVAASGKKAAAPATPATRPAEIMVIGSYPQASKSPEAKQFLVTYTESGSADLRTGLGDTIADYTDWLGARTDAEWALVAPAFTKSDNPYLNASALQDPAQVQSRLDKFNALLTPPPTGGKTKGQRKLTEPKPAPAPKPLKTPKAPPEGPPRAEAAPAVTVASDERVTKRKSKLDYEYRTATLSDGRAVDYRFVDKQWVFRATNDPIPGATSRADAAAAIATMASEGTLPDGVVTTAEEAAKLGERAETVTAVDELEADINDFITVLDSSEDRASRNAAISGLQDSLIDPAMTPELRTKAKDYLATIETEVGAVGLSEMTGADTAASQLSEMIEAFNAAPGDVTGTWQKDFRKLAAEVRKSAPDAMLGDRRLVSFLKANNDPNFVRTDGVKQIAGTPGAFSLADWNTTDNVVDLDGKPITRIAAGRMQLIARNFMGKLARPPKLTVVRNQVELKTRFPKLYAEAVAARPQGDFDSANAAGYSFGDGQVIIFSDRVASEQHLQFVLAHETLGHYGLRGIMPGPKFDALMEKLYTDYSSVQRVVDAAMASNEKLSRAEAVEEYLSDYAAVLETNIVAKIWNAIKGFLNNLGIKTGDEMVRYLLDQSRTYARYGTGVTFDAQLVAQRLHNVESSGDTGRFSSGQSLRDVNIAAGLMRDTIGGLPMSIEEGWKYLSGQRVNSVDSWDRFKSSFLSLANFRARQNPGLSGLEEILDEARNISMSTKVEFNESLHLVLNRAIAGEVGGISDAQTARVNEMLYAAQRYNVAQVRKMKDLGNVPLFRMEGGKLIPNEPEVNRLKKLGRRTLAEMRDGFSYDVTFEEAGKTITKAEKFAGYANLTEKSIEWRGYIKIRDAMDKIELRLLEARYLGSLQERDLAFRQIAATVPDGELTAAERAVMTKLAQVYGNLYTSNITQDETGRATLDTDFQTYANDILRTSNAALIGKEQDRFDDLMVLLTSPREFLKEDEKKGVRRTLPAVMEQQAAEELITQLKAFKSRMRLGENKYVVQNKIKQVILSELSSKDADKYTKRTIATGYTPILREGKFQIRVEATVNGKPVRLQDNYREQLVYSQVNTPAEALELKTKINDMFGTTKFEVMAYNQDAGEYKLQEVTLRAVSESSLDAIAAPPELNLNEFVRGLRQFDITLTPQKMEDVIVALTKQNSAARNRLERVFTPGADLDGVMATMKHIESRASTISKVIVRPRLAELMDRSMSSTMALWNADARDPKTGKSQLETLKDRADKMAANATATKAEKADAQRAYERYAYMYNQTNPKNMPNRGNQFYNEAANTVAFLDGNKNVDESDFGSGPMVSRIRAATSMMQLGGSVATGALNMLSVYTNGIPYLSSYNPKTGFGGGFSAGKVVVELHRAAAHVGGPGITSREANTAEFYDKVARDPALQKKYNLKAHEAQFIADEIRDGAMIPAQSNALVGTARGRTTQGWQQKFLDGWMWTFNVTEQASRRSLGLTAYRLEYTRKLEAGASEVEAAAGARKFAVQALQYTMGEYSVLNRPPAWRSGIQSFLYMYKVFPTTSVQMFMNLSRNGKVGMIAGLWLLSGLAGLPFAEDLEDLADTLAQKLKVPGWQGARYETAKFIDSIMPGMSPYLLKGLVNQFVEADVAGRTSLGDLFPGTDILLAGADVSRGISEIAGPAPSMLIGTATFAADLLAMPFSATTSLETVAREAPVTMIRALGDTYAYLQSGAVVDRRGYTVTPDMTAGTIIARALGFYPGSAAAQYDMIRSAKRMTDYQREVVTAYRTAWVKAMMRNDRAGARAIEDEVDGWNESAKGSALEIKNFAKNSQRALGDAKRPAMERTLRSAPNAAERDLQNMIDLMTAN